MSCRQSCKVTMPDPTEAEDAAPDAEVCEGACLEDVSDASFVCIYCLGWDLHQQLLPFDVTPKWQQLQEPGVKGHRNGL